MSIVFSSYKHPKLPISIKTPVSPANDDSISMNYLFANMLVAWL